MAEFNFPADKTELVPPGTGPLVTGDTWTSPTDIKYVWNGYAWTVSGESGGDIYLSKTKDDTAAGEITFQGQTTHEAGANVSGGTLTTTNDAVISTTNVGRGSGTNTGTSTVVSVNGLQLNTSGVSNTVVGYNASANNTQGNNNVAIGAAPLENNTTGSQNVAISHNALNACTTGNYNVAIGGAALVASTTAASNVAVGAGAFQALILGEDNTAIGRAAGRYFQNGNDCTSITNSTCLGADARISGPNQVQIGSSGTTVYAASDVVTRSDERDKTDIRDTKLGLDFVNSLRPVDFRWDQRDDYFDEKEVTLKDGTTDTKLVPVTKDGSRARTRFHHGLIAQEVKAAADAQGVDFAGYKDGKIDGGCDVLSLGYTELIAPLIKAVQELSAENEELKARLAALEGPN